MRILRRTLGVGAFLAIVGLVLVGLWTWGVLSTLSLAAEIGIAVAIYYEIEENRAATFLAEASGKAYAARERIYNTFASVAGPDESLGTRIALFDRELRSNPKLRRACDLQILEFSRAQYSLRRSLLHRKLLVRWFPQVFVRLWIIMGPYIRRRHWPNELKMDVAGLIVKSFEALTTEGLANKGIEIYGGAVTVMISPDEFKRQAKLALEFAGSETATAASEVVEL